MKSYKTFVYPFDAIGNPSVFLVTYLFAIIAASVGGIFDWFILLLITSMVALPICAIAIIEKNIYEIVHIDSNGIYTRKVSFQWDDNCYKGVCTATMGHMEHPKCLYFSKEPIVDEARIMLKRNTKSTVVFPLNKKSKIALKEIAPEIYKQFQYEIEKRDTF
ncbi:MAG: hypothetical protein GX051_05380 [Clostridiales bacterium]|nr:hypothetical protein [Clostridiales bacterium]